MTSMLDELDAIPEEKHMEICRKADELQRMNLSEKDKAVAEKAAKLIARDYGEVLRNWRTNEHVIPYTSKFAV